jgi:formylglycine-generating enzyme required for sulfatase activity
LPTEAEWEYAARGGNKSRGYKYSGSNNLDEVGWYGKNSGHETLPIGQKTQPVGQKKPNELGLYDMSGNVQEWCNDFWFYSYDYKIDPTTNLHGPFGDQVWGYWRAPFGPNEDDHPSFQDRSTYVSRGGSWSYGEDTCRTTDRSSCRYHNFGFRLVCHLVDSAFHSIADNLVLVEGGSFMMGSKEGYVDEDGDWCEYKYEDDESEVHLSAYHISKYPVTQAQWQAVMGNNPSRFEGDTRPVECVSKKDCWLFIEKLNELTGKRYRLPTEAEWEYAARGGNKSCGNKYSGSNNLDEVAWYDENSGGETHAVGQKKPNELGLYDMSGNVWEWCKDLYDEDDYAYSVYRGGSWCHGAQYCRSAYRTRLTSDRYDYLGFRLVSQ